jgi:hypothetical protein
MTNTQPNGHDPVRRGVVKKRYQEVTTLAGFMDNQHFLGFAQESLNTMDETDRDGLLASAQNARDFVAGFSPLTDFTTEIRPVDASLTDRITANPQFQDAFGSVSHRFAWIRLDHLLALQVFVRSGDEAVPSDEQGLIDFALPSEWGVPAELTFIPPFGPIYIVSSSPHLTGIQVRAETAAGRVVIEPPTHINLVQVVQFAGRYYLRNGYHRVVGALASGTTELPALIVDGNQPADVELANMGAAGFSVPYWLVQPRPPLVSDFTSSATVMMEMRERRYGASVTLQVSPLNIGV